MERIFCDMSIEISGQQLVVDRMRLLTFDVACRSTGPAYMTSGSVVVSSIASVSLTTSGEWGPADHCTVYPNPCPL